MDFLIKKIKLNKTKGLSTETETPKVGKVLPLNRFCWFEKISLSAIDLIDLRTTYLKK